MWIVRVQRLLLTVLLCANSTNDFASADELTLSKIQMQNGIKLIAQGIASNESVVLVGTIAEEGFSRGPEQSTVTGEDFGTVLKSLNIVPVYVQEVLRAATPMPKIVYLQLPGPSGTLERRWVPATTADGKAKLFFLTQPNRLSDGALQIGIKGSLVQQMIRENRTKATPLELFRMLGVERHLNLNSWFELYKDQGAFAVDVTSAQFLPENGGKQITGTNAKTSRKYAPTALKNPFPEDFVDDVRVILKGRLNRSPSGVVDGPMTPQADSAGKGLKTEAGRELSRTLAISHDTERKAGREREN